MKKIYFLGLIITSFLISCGPSESSQKNQIKEDGLENIDLTPPNDALDIKDNLTECVTYIYPVKVYGENKEVIVLKSEEEHENLNQEWFTKHEQPYLFVYPFRVQIVSLSESKKVSNLDTLTTIVEENCGENGKLPLGL